MRYPARLQTSIDLLSRITMGNIPMDNVIRDFMAARRFIGSKDRTAIVERIYRIIRAHARLGWWVEKGGLADTARNRVLADLMLNDQTKIEELAESFSGEKHDPERLTDQELNFAKFLEGKNITDDSMSLSVRCECPDWAFEKLQNVFGEDFESHLMAMIDSAPLDLRVNILKSSLDDAIDSLKLDKVFVEKTKYSPIGLRAKGKPFMGDSKAYKKGVVEIQDEGSQLIALLTGAKPGMRILDFCAGGGGKTLAIAAMMDNKGNVVATDNSTRRLEKGRPRFKKAGFHNVELRSLEEEQHRKWLRRQKETMDVVLVDAPCSSSGTWRRNPDLRWKWYGPKLDEIIQMQVDILDKVADKVKMGGRLVYATCSLFKEENEDQITAFLSRHPNFKIVPLKNAWGFGKENLPCDGDYLKMRPKDHQTDGFFAAIMEKTTI